MFGKKANLLDKASSIAFSLPLAPTGLYQTVGVLLFFFAFVSLILKRTDVKVSARVAVAVKN